MEPNGFGNIYLIYLLDFYHAAEHLQAFADSAFKEEKELKIACWVTSNFIASLLTNFLLVITNFKEAS